MALRSVRQPRPRLFRRTLCKGACMLLAAAGSARLTGLGQLRSFVPLGAADVVHPEAAALAATHEVALLKALPLALSEVSGTSVMAAEKVAVEGFNPVATTTIGVVLLVAVAVVINIVSPPKVKKTGRPSEEVKAERVTRILLEELERYREERNDERLVGAMQLAKQNGAPEALLQMALATLQQLSDNPPPPAAPETAPAASGSKGAEKK
eukprot:TRINITY_DN59993_c0_g1_i1.p2 TRINITY_DN59993_c0_g1~~TRINITY_DN59993_c0_g1_i1.p2  ORF type:complete len:233 (+),score=56.59 TRINITY_DN59993_c0_g1_i1:70-699(+)